MTLRLPAGHCLSAAYLQRNARLESDKPPLPKSKPSVAYSYPICKGKGRIMNFKV